jgi:hypothetical protein
MVGEKDGAADRITAVLGTQRGEVSDQRLLLVGGDESVVKPASL